MNKFVRVRRLINYLLNDRTKFLNSLITHMRFCFPDKLYLSIKYRLSTGTWINWSNPMTFNEKLQWLKLYNRVPEYTKMVDKYDVKKYVSNIIGEQYIIPTLGVWDSFAEINFNSLPDAFVLKTTHSGGNTGVIICKDKSNFNIDLAKKKINKSLKENIYWTFREWPYKNVKPRILAENFISNLGVDTLLDYKFYCFNGEPKVLLIASGRNLNLCFDYYDMDFNHLPFQQGGLNSKEGHSRPKLMSEMIEIARKLSQDIPHVRVDLYEANGKIYFGELTFFDSSGLAVFEPEEWDYILGSWIKLPQSYKKTSAR